MNTSALLMLVVLSGMTPKGPVMGMGGASPMINPVAGIVDFSSFGSSSWYGLPAPTVACLADASGGGMTCAGATASKQGSPTTVGSPFYPAGFSGAQQMAASLGGSNLNYFDLGDVGRVNGGDFTICGVVQANTTGTGVYAARLAIGTGGWDLYDNGSFSLYIANAVGGAAFSIGASVPKTWNVLCASYHYVTNGTSVVKANLNGTAATDSTTMRSMPDATANNFLIGKDGVNTAAQNGISRISFWTGYAASTSELNLAVRSQMSLLAVKPAGTAISYARASSPLCCPTDSAHCYYVGSGMPCVTSAGLQVWPAGKNLALQSEVLKTSWTKTAGMSITDDQGIGPDLAQTMDLLTSTSNDDEIYQQGTAASTATKWVGSAWFRADATTKVGSLMVECGNTTACTCYRSDGGTCTATNTSPVPSGYCLAYGTFDTSAPVRMEARATCQTTSTTNYISIAAGQWKTSYATILVGEAQLEAGVDNASPYYPTTTGAVTWPATAVSMANPLAGLVVGQFCYGIRMTPGGTWATTTGTTAGDNGSATRVRLAAGAPETWTYSGGAYRQTNASAALTGSAERTFVGCCNGLNCTNYIDGAAVASSVTGAGTGVPTIATPLYLGSADGSGFADSIGGVGKKWCIFKTYAAAARCLR